MHSYTPYICNIISSADIHRWFQLPNDYEYIMSVQCNNIYAETIHIHHIEHTTKRILCVSRMCLSY